VSLEFPSVSSKTFGLQNKNIQFVEEDEFVSDMRGHDHWGKHKEPPSGVPPGPAKSQTLWI
jgi:hypothetical protein